MTGTRQVALILLLAAASSLLGARPARALEVTIATGAMTTRQEVHPAPSSALTQKRRMGLAFGGFFNFAPGFLKGSVLAMESGLLFLLKRTEVDDPSRTPSQQLSTFRAFQFPLMLRVQPLKWLSLGAGGYYTQGFSRVSAKANNNSIGEASYDERQLSKADYGATGGVRLNFPIAPGLSAALDGRYLHGLADVDNSGSPVSRKLREAQLLVGLTVGTI